MSGENNLHRRTILNAAAALGTLGAVEGGLASTDYAASDGTLEASSRRQNLSLADVPGCPSELGRYANDDGKIGPDGLRNAIGDWQNDSIATAVLQSAIDNWRSGNVLFQSGSISLGFEGGDSGPFVADGSDTATVNAAVTDDTGNPLSGVSVEATLIEGRDNRRPINVQDDGGGSFTIDVQSTIAGQAELRVYSGDLCEEEYIGIEFEPGAAAEISIEDVNRTPPGETGQTAQGSDHLVKTVSPTAIDGDSSHREHPIRANFSVTIRDSNSNVLPIPNEEIQVTSSDTVNKSVDGNVVNVTGELSDPVRSSEQNNLTGWGTMDVTVDSLTIPGSTTQVQLEFPFVTVEQRAMEINGEVENVLRFYAINYTVMTNYNFFLPIPEEYIGDVVNPQSDNGFGDPIVQPDGAGEGVYIFSEVPREATQELKGTVEPFVDVVLSDPTAVPGKEGFDSTDIEYLGLDFEGIEEIPIFVNPFKTKYVDVKTLCLTIWKGPKTNENRVEKSKQQIKKVIIESLPNCCPLMRFKVQEKEITQDEWDDIVDGDGLDQWDDTETVEDEDGNKIEKPVLKDEEEDLFDEFHDDGCLNAYFVPKIKEGLWGRAYSESSDNGSDVHSDTNGKMDGDSVVISNSDPDSDDWDYKTLVHELGHVLGELNDYEPAGNAPGGKDNIQTDPLKPGTAGFWSEAQCEKIVELCEDN